MDKVLLKLNILAKKNAKNTWINKDKELYRLICNEEIYKIAYENLKNNKGALTAGTDEKTLDGFSKTTIATICKQMKNETFQFTRAKQIYIPKASGKLRPLGIPSSKDKIVQEVIRLILENIWDSSYNPTFMDVSHGFRKKRGTHSALQYVEHKFKGINWIIEDDIKGAYDNINHVILLNLLEKRIQPGRFLRLIDKGLKAGYLEFQTPIDPLFGTPQGSVVSPILSNIYFHELDLFVTELCNSQNEIYEKSRKDIPRIRNPIYEKKRFLFEKIKALYKKYPTRENSKILKTVKLDLIKIDPRIHQNTSIRIKYVRYADDWIVGVDGSKNTALEIKGKIQEFLENTLQLSLNEEKTKITHLKSDKAFFLGYEIRVDSSVKITKVTKKINNTRKITYLKRTTGQLVDFRAPIKRLLNKLQEKGFCDNNKFPTSKKIWTIYEDHVIVENYNSILRGILTYYSGAHNQLSLRNIRHILMYSCAMTLGHRHRQNIASIFGKYGKVLRIKKGKKSFVSLYAPELSCKSRFWHMEKRMIDPFNE